MAKVTGMPTGLGIGDWKQTMADGSNSVIGDDDLHHQHRRRLHQCTARWFPPCSCLCYRFPLRRILGLKRESYEGIDGGLEARPRDQSAKRSWKERLGTRGGRTRDENMQWNGMAKR